MSIHKHLQTFALCLAGMRIETECRLVHGSRTTQEFQGCDSYTWVLRAGLICPWRYQVYMGLHGFTSVYNVFITIKFLSFKFFTCLLLRFTTWSPSSTKLRRRKWDLRQDTPHVGCHPVVSGTRRLPRTSLIKAANLDDLDENWFIFSGQHLWLKGDWYASYLLILILVAAMSFSLLRLFWARPMSTLPRRAPQLMTPVHHGSPAPLTFQHLRCHKGHRSTGLEAPAILERTRHGQELGWLRMIW